MAKVNRYSYTLLRAVASGRASGARPPHLKSVPPILRLAPGCYTYPILYFKNVAPPSGFCPPLLLNPGGGPDVTSRSLFSFDIFDDPASATSLTKD